MSEYQAIVTFGDKLIHHSDHLAWAVDGSEQAYYETGYFLVYATFLPLRKALNLTAKQTTTTIYTSELQLAMALVGQRIGVPSRTWVGLSPERQLELHAIVTPHLIAISERQQWYDRFKWIAEEFGPGDLLWEFAEQVSRSTGYAFLEGQRDNLRLLAMAALGDLEPRTFLDEIRGVVGKEPGK